MIKHSNLVQAADQSMNSLLGWGIGGVILAVFVAPTFWLMVKTAQKRDDERSTRDVEESKARSLREDKLVEALAKSVEQQRDALDQWLRFEEEEKTIHLSLIDRFDSIVSALQKINDRLESSAERDREILKQLSDLKRTA